MWSFYIVYVFPLLPFVALSFLLHCIAFFSFNFIFFPLVIGLESNLEFCVVDVQCSCEHISEWERERRKAHKLMKKKKLSVLDMQQRSQAMCTLSALCWSYFSFSFFLMAYNSWMDDTRRFNSFWYEFSWSDLRALRAALVMCNVYFSFIISSLTRYCSFFIPVYGK